MIYNCCHTFTLEAKDPPDFEEKIARYRKLLHSASMRLEIGYAPGIVTGNPAPDYEQPPDDDKPLETLFT